MNIYLSKVFNKEIKWYDAFQCLDGAYRKAGEGLLIRAGNNRMRGNGLNLEEDGSRLDIRKKFFTVRVVRHWHRLAW